MVDPVKRPEVWLRGPVPDVPGLLQPVAHALLQAGEEAAAAVSDLPPDRLWERPAGVASVGFHLQHLSGALDRIFTYARGEVLTAGQLQSLANEGARNPELTIPTLLEQFHKQIDQALGQIRTTPTEILENACEVGRAKLPSTVIGLMFHAAEHTQRHIGQLIVTARIVKASGSQK